MNLHVGNKTNLVEAPTVSAALLMTQSKQMNWRGWGPPVKRIQASIPELLNPESTAGLMQMIETTVGLCTADFFFF